MQISIRPLHEIEYSQWEPMWLDYVSPYILEMSSKVHRTTFDRLVNESYNLHGIVAITDRPIGFAHFLFHPSTFDVKEVCYLQDLYVNPAFRGNGIAGTLIKYVSTYAQERNMSCLYWKTRPGNVNARALYDKIAVQSDFATYKIQLDSEIVSETVHNGDIRSTKSITPF